MSELNLGTTELKLIFTDLVDTACGMPTESEEFKFRIALAKRIAGTNFEKWCKQANVSFRTGD